MVFSAHQAKGKKTMTDNKQKQEAEKVDFTVIAQQCRHARDENLKDLLKRHEGVIKAANLRERKIGRVGMPLAFQLDNRTDEIPFLCGLKKAVVYLGGTAGCILGGWKIKQIFFG